MYWGVGWSLAGRNKQPTGLLDTRTTGCLSAHRLLNVCTMHSCNDECYMASNHRGDEHFREERGVNGRPVMRCTRGTSRCGTGTAIAVGQYQGFGSGSQRSYSYRRGCRLQKTRQDVDCGRHNGHTIVRQLESSSVFQSSQKSMSKNP